MSINSYRPTELMAQRQKASNAKNNTNNLTFADSKNECARSAAALKVRDRKSHLEIDALEKQTNESAMLLELDLLERDYING